MGSPAARVKLKTSRAGERCDTEFSPRRTASESSSYPLKPRTLRRRSARRGARAMRSSRFGVLCPRFGWAGPSRVFHWSCSAMSWRALLEAGLTLPEAMLSLVEKESRQAYGASSRPYTARCCRDRAFQPRWRRRSRVPRPVRRFHKGQRENRRPARGAWALPSLRAAECAVRKKVIGASCIRRFSRASVSWWRCSCWSTSFRASRRSMTTRVVTCLGCRR